MGSMFCCVFSGLNENQSQKLFQRIYITKVCWSVHKHGTRDWLIPSVLAVIAERLQNDKGVRIALSQCTAFRV